MKNIKLFLVVYCGFVLSMVSGFSFATSSDASKKARGGTVICSGNFNTASNTRGRWILHNISQTKSLNLDRMRVYNATGALIYDSNVNGPAPSSTGVAFGLIGPLQTIMFRTETLVTAGLLPGNLPSTERPTKTIFDWSSHSGARMLTPYVLLTRPGPGSARHARDCRSVSFRQKRK